MASITHLMGADFRLYIWTGAAYVEMDGETGFSMSQARDKVEITNKDSAYNKEYIQTNYGATFTLDGKLDQGDAVLEYLDAAIRNRTQVLFEAKTEDSDKYTGTAVVDNVDRTADFADVVSVSIGLTLTAAITRAAA